MPEPSSRAGTPAGLDSAPTTVLFDLDDTLCRPAVPRDEQLTRLFDRAGVTPFFDTTEFYREMGAVDADSEAELYDRVFTRLAAAHDRPEAAPALTEAAMADTGHDPTDVVALPGAHEVLDTLAADYRLGLVTNGPEPRQRSKLAALDMLDAFDATVYAEPGRAVKPAPEPFERALDALDAEPARTLHVGNSRSSDVAGAHAIGCISVWLPDPHTPREGPEPHHRIERLDAVPSLIRSLGPD